MVLVAALSAVNGFRVFSEIYLLSGATGGPGGASTTLVMLIQQIGRGLTGEVGYASALSFVLFVITLGLLLITLSSTARRTSCEALYLRCAISALLTVLVVSIGPFLWQFATSIKGPGEDVFVPDFIPNDPTFANYAAVADVVPVWTFALNSLLVASVNVSRTASAGRWPAMRWHA